MAILEPSTRLLRDGSHAVIRSATREDAEGLARLYREIIAEGRWTLARAGERQPVADDEAAEIDRLNAAGGSLYLVACEDSRILGTARVEEGGYGRTAHFADVHSVWVRRERRRAGVADALLEALVAWARACPQIEKLGLFVFSTSEAAVSLYRKHGFIEEGRSARDVKFEDGSYADTVILGCFTGPGP